LHVNSLKLDCSVPSLDVRLPHLFDVDRAASVYDFSGLRLLSCFYSRFSITICLCCLPFFVYYALGKFTLVTICIYCNLVSLFLT
jgi:hypothetical protein